MAQYEGPDMKRIEPNLLPGEREVITEFQDKTCCQANDFLSSAWSVSKKDQFGTIISLFSGFKKISKFCVK